MSQSQPFSEKANNPQISDTPSPATSSAHEALDNNGTSKAVTEQPSSVTPPRKRKLFGKDSKGNEDGGAKQPEAEAEESAVPRVGLFAMFRFATNFELFLNGVGLVLAAAAGATAPLMTVIFGRLTTEFTKVLSDCYCVLTSKVGHPPADRC